MDPHCLAPGSPPHSHRCGRQEQLTPRGPKCNSQRKRRKNHHHRHRHWDPGEAKEVPKARVPNAQCPRRGVSMSQPTKMSC
eukprot:10349101-Karenia_brevis.AAC.1